MSRLIAPATAWVLFCSVGVIGQVTGKVCDPREHGAIAGDSRLDTDAIQAAIDQCAQGGGVVLLEGGRYRSGGIELRNDVTLRIAKGVVLEASTDWRDYFEGNWEDSFIRIFDVKNVRIEGGGIIDGMDCENPAGEEGFRGPHGIYIQRSSDISLSDVTIRNSGNYNIICRKVTRGRFEKVSVRGGHDGLNAWESSDFVIKDCDIRTGDDGIAGTDNRNFLVEDTRINSSCNAFRFACLGLTVRRGRIWGPGEFKHLVSGRNNMLGAFVHFSPEEKSPVPVSDNWLIEDVVVDSAIALYLYDYEKGLWQQGRPVAKVRFNRVKATRMQQPVVVIGDGKGSFIFNDVEITHDIKSLGIERGPTPESDGFAFAISKAARLELDRVRVTSLKSLSRAAVSGRQLGIGLLDDFTFQGTTSSTPVLFPETATLVPKAHRWAFDVDARDSTGGAPGTLLEGAQVGPVAGAQGGGALSIPGAGRVSFPQAGFKQAFRGYTAVFRFMPETVQGEQAILEEGDQETGLAIRLKGNSLEALVRSNSRSLTAFKAGVAAGAWNFGAVTWEKGMLKVYLNGASDLGRSEDPALGEVSAHSGGLSIGGWEGPSAFPASVSGTRIKLDEVRIHRGAALDSLRIAGLADAFPFVPVGILRKPQHASASAVHRPALGRALYWHGPDPINPGCFDARGVKIHPRKKPRDHPSAAPGAGPRARRAAPGQ